jgi:hypothetical protein
LALSTATGTFTAPTSTGTKSVTGLGFQPSALILWGDALTSSVDTGTTMFPWFGFAADASHQAVCSQSILTSTGYQDNANCAALTAAEMLASLSSFDAGGFTLNFTAVNVAYIINYLAIGGGDLTNATVAQITAPASTGAQATTGVGFKPDCILTLTIQDTNTPPDSFGVGTIWPSIGCALSSSARWARGASDSSNPTSYQRTVKAISGTDDAVTIEADLTSMDADGFTLNFSTTVSGAYIYVLCLKGPQFAVGSIAQPSSTGNQSVTGLAFQPAAELFTTDMLVASTSPASNANESVGAAVDSTHRSVAGSQYVSGAARTSQNAATCIRMYGGSTTIVAAADFVSQDATGFTINWTSANATARQVLYLAIGPKAAGVTDPFPLGYGPEQQPSPTILRL